MKGLLKGEFGGAVADWAKIESLEDAGDRFKRKVSALGFTKDVKDVGDSYGRNVGFELSLFNPFKERNCFLYKRLSL